MIYPLGKEWNNLKQTHRCGSLDLQLQLLTMEGSQRGFQQEFRECLFFGTPCSMFPFAHAILCLIQHERNWIKRLCQRSLGTLQAFEDAQEDALVFLLLMRTRNHKECVENCFYHSARANFLMDLIIIHSDLTTTIPRSLSLLTYWKSVSDDHVTYASLSLSF